MSWAADARREPDLTMVDRAGAGRPRAAAARPRRRQAIRARSSPPWCRRTRRSGPTAAPDDAGLALIRAHGTVAEAVAQRLNRMPRRLALDQLELAGVRPRPATHRGRPSSGWSSPRAAGRCRGGRRERVLR